MQGQAVECVIFQLPYLCTVSPCSQEAASAWLFVCAISHVNSSIYIQRRLYLPAAIQEKQQKHPLSLYL